MIKVVDDKVSTLPIQITDLKVDKSKLKIKNMAVTAVGHIPGRILRRSDVQFKGWAVAYIADGSGTYQVNGGPVQKIKKGTIFFIWPGTLFSYGPDENASWEEYYLNFEGNRIQEWVEQQFIRKGEASQIGADRLWVQKIETIASLLESGIPANGDRAALLFESLLFEFALMYEQSLNHSKADKMMHIIEDLNHRIYDPIDADMIAKRLHISVSTLRRLVRANTGYPLNEYLHRLKISEAKKLLINTDATVKEVALTLRYEDVYYFSRLFKKFAGVPPKMIRLKI